MKKIIYVLAIATLLASCETETAKDYVKFSGTILNQNSDSLVIIAKDYKKVIKVNPDGKFSDTLHVSTGRYRLFDGGEYASLYLKNGYDLTMSLDTEEFDETIKFTGNGAETSNYLAEKSLLQEDVLSDDSLFEIEREVFEKKLSEISSKFSNHLSESKNLDQSFIDEESEGINKMVKNVEDYYDQKQYVKEVLAKGSDSPKFENYENHNGETTSLDDLKGKYVYIDVWATWCGPCKKEIPFLKEVEKAYSNKNIEFVGISVDREKDHEAWKKMVSEKELAGVQLFADDNWKSKFVTDYKITGIPRFILVDPEGNIVSADAPRPSSEKLKELLDSVL